MTTSEKLPLGVVVERREAANRWADYAWQPVAVIPGAPALDDPAEWRLMREGDNWAHFLVGTLEMELFRGETEGYKFNLSTGQPQVFVVLAPGEEADDPDVVAFLVTACPYEAEKYMESGDQIVEGVPMPPEVEAWVAAFVETHHVDQPFKKRKNKKAYDPRKGGFQRSGPRVPRDGGGGHG